MADHDPAAAEERIDAVMKLVDDWSEADFLAAESEFSGDEGQKTLRARADAVRGELRQAIRALAAPKAEAWQDIATAPKGDEQRDGHNHYGPFILVWWPSAFAPMRARWWRRDDTQACNFLSDRGYAIHPSHWMPLPAPPTSPAPQEPK